MTSRVVVLGGCGAWPEAGRACSGFVIEHEGARIVLDLGYGTLPRLLALLGSSTGAGIDAVVVTHQHPDHMVDLHGLFRARWFGDRQGPAVPLYAPEGVLDRVAYLEENDRAAVEHVFDWRPLPATTYQVGPFLLESVGLPHHVPNAGVRLSAPGLTVAFTGDTGPAPALAQLGRHADLFIAEASDQRQRPGTPPVSSGAQLHLTSSDAAKAATAAGARRLIETPIGGNAGVYAGEEPIPSCPGRVAAGPVGDRRYGAHNVPLPAHPHP